MRVLVVDDSVVFRSQVKNCLAAQDDIVVAGSAANGRIALEMLSFTECDLITLDLEMPEMGGLEFLQIKQMRGLKQKVIVFAASTAAGGSQVMDALKAGADDFVAKPGHMQSLEAALDLIQKDLLPKILQFKKNHGTLVSAAPRVSPPSEPQAFPMPSVSVQSFRPSMILIASSTGGPNALEVLLSGLGQREHSPPILIVQHMPAGFTEALARRIQALSGQVCAEARDGETLLQGRIYVAPGDFHMSVIPSLQSAQLILKVDQKDKRNSVRPAADVLFESVAQLKKVRVAAFVLTGMGEDGKQGAIEIKKSGGLVLIQDKDSSVVWGMPGAVHAAGAYDAQGNLEVCRSWLHSMINHSQ